MSDTMKPFMEPRSVALIGVPRATGPGAYNTLENMLNAGFSGSVYPINPKADEVLDTRAYPSVLNIDGDIDLAVVMTARSEVPRAVWECTRKDIRAITIVSQGFADADDEGREMQEEIVRIARQGGASILGPNTWGTANPFNYIMSPMCPSFPDDSHSRAMNPGIAATLSLPLRARLLSQRKHGRIHVQPGSRNSRLCGITTT